MVTDLARRIRIDILASKLSFLLFGDMQLDLKLPRKLSFLSACCAEIAHIDSATCIIGKNIDYLVASSALLHALTALEVVPTPWKIHCGLALSLRRAPRELIAKFIIKPRRIVTC